MGLRLTCVVLLAGCAPSAPVYEAGDPNDPLVQMMELISSSCSVADCPAGYNVIQGTANDDNLQGTNGNDCILGFGGQDKIDGKDGNDFICGGAGDDELKGSAGADTIYGEAGQDRIYGADGADALFGGDGDDYIEGGNDDDSIDGQGGNDRLYGGNGNDFVRGSDGDDTLDGENGDDALDGGNGHDTLIGGNGNDALTGGPESDNLNGGSGNDSCDEPGTSCENISAPPDTTAPNTTVTTANDATFTQFIVITGTASDTAPGTVATVQVSANNGGTWTNVTSPGTSWSHTFAPGAPGTYALLFRAVDSAGNVDASPASVRVIWNCTPETAARSLVVLGSADGANGSTWPMNIGWTGELGGDWRNTGAGAFPTATTLPTMTSFFKEIAVCPNANSHINFVADVDTSGLSSANSDTTLVLYFFDATGQSLGHATSSTLAKSARTSLPLYEAWIPAATRKILLAPTAYLAAGETGTLKYMGITAQYVPGNSYAQAAVVATESFDAYAAASLNPTGWTETSAGDWFVEPPYNWATLTNPVFNGNPAGLPLTASLSRTFTLPARQSGDLLQAKILASSTFTDATSNALMRLTFNDAAATKATSQKVWSDNYNDLYAQRVAIPASATTVTIEVEAYLGPNEQSSLIVDDLLIRLIRP